MPERSFSVRLTARVDEYVNQMNRAKQATAGWSKETEQNMRKVGGQMQSAGANMTKYVTVPLVALGVGAAAAAVSWESSWAGVTKTVNGTSAELSKLEGDLRGMAKTLPASHKEIAAVARAAGQLGVETSSIASFTKTMIDLGETTNLTADEAATSIAQLMNVMQTAPQDVGRLGAALVDLGNNGASTERDIIMMAQRIAGAGKIVGMSEADVLGLANALASVGIEVEAGGSAISRIMVDMAKAVATGSDGLATWAQVAGMSSAQFQAAFKDDAAGAIASFVEGLGRVNAAGGDVFSILESLGQEDVRVSRALLTMANSGDLLRDSLAMGAQAWEDNTALADEAAKRYDTTAARFEVFRNKLVDAAITVADAALPALNGILDWTGDAVDAFADLPGPIQGVVAGFLALAAAAGPVIWIGGTLMRNFFDLKNGVVAFKGALQTMGLSVGAASTVMGVFAGVVAAAGVAFLAYQHFTAKQREVSARAKEVAGALDEATTAALANADATDGAATAHAALSDALTMAGTDGEKLTSALGTLKMTSDDAFSTLAAISDDAVAGLQAVAENAGYTAEQAEALARVVAASDQQWTLNSAIESSKYAASGWHDLVAAGVELDDQVIAIAVAMEELQRQQAKTDFDKTLRPWLTQKAAMSDVNQALMTLAETQSDTLRTGDGLVPLYESFVDLTNRFVDDSGNMKSAWDIVMGPLLGGEGATAADDLAAGFDGIGEGMETVEGNAADLAKELGSVTDAYDDARNAGDRYRDSLSAIVDPQRDFVESQEELVKSMDALKTANEDNGDSLDVFNEKGQKNRDLVKEQVDAILAYGPAARGMGKSAYEAALEQNGFRLTLLDTMEQLGFNREEAEAYIAQLGLTPENLVTSVQIDDTVATEETIKRLLEDLDTIDEGAEAEIEALYESGQFDAALSKIYEIQAAAARGAFMTITVANISNGQIADSSLRNALEGRVSGSATGRYVDGPMLSLIGEAGAEVVLPLTRPDRMAELLADPRVGPKVAAALGLGVFADGGIIGRVLQAGGSGAPAAGQSETSRMSIMHETGALSDTDYRSYLAAQMAGLDQFSEEWFRVWREIKTLDDDAAQRRADQVKAAEDAAAAEVAAEDQKMAAMFELGQISAADYEAYLQRRLGDFEMYSSDWMTRWRELSGIQEQQEKDAEQRREDEAAAALKRLEVLYDRAEARRDLAVAERELGESWADVGEAQAAVGAAKTDEDRARAQEQVTASFNRVADDAWQGVKARARTMGLDEGTREWARFIRSEVMAYAQAHPELALRLGEYLTGVPKFAAGGFMPATAGGSLAMLGRVAEAGQDEWILPDHKLRGALVSAASLGTSSSDGLLRQIVDRLNRLEGGINFNGPISVGTRDDLGALRREADRLLWKQKAGARG